VWIFHDAKIAYELLSATFVTIVQAMLRFVNCAFAPSALTIALFDLDWFEYGFRRSRLLTEMVRLLFGVEKLRVKREGGPFRNRLSMLEEFEFHALPRRGRAILHSFQRLILLFSISVFGIFDNNALRKALCLESVRRSLALNRFSISGFGMLGVYLFFRFSFVVWLDAFVNGRPVESRRRVAPIVAFLLRPESKQIQRNA
jgi:hypothetical protein